MTRRGVLLAGAACASLFGCGFTPVYRPGGAAAALRNQVAIGVTRGRAGFELREQLENRLGPAVPDAPWQLTFRLDITRTGVALTEEEGITRERLTGHAAFTVRHRGAHRGGVVLRGRVRAVTAYSTTSATFASAAAATDARVRLARALADKIAERIALTAGDWAR
ncbi:MAG: hypothetical protein GDA53_05420 [Rhodobacteraceae bacterium]|nr:hypothetical protein [Paracoccaceae bacterium]